MRTLTNMARVGIIDFESWRPVFRQNFGVLVPYKDVSYELEKKIHWWWPKTWIQAEAKQRFEKSARQFMQTTLSVAKQMRPNALWGYYGFPYCFNMASNNQRESCADKVPQENDRTHWLWLESSALYPSVYSPQQLSPRQLSALVRGRVREAARVARGVGTHILPYVWFRYRDGGYLTEKDLDILLQTLYESEASGFIIWGSSNDVNTVAKCNKLLNYVDNVFGPAIAKYLKPAIRIQDEMEAIDSNKTTINSHMTTTIKYNLDDSTINIETNNTTTGTTVKPLSNNIINIETNSNITATIKPISDEYIVYNDTKIQLDPDYHWDPPDNYTQDIKQNVEEEILKKTGYNVSLNENVETETFTNKESILLKFLLHLISDDQTKRVKEEDNEKDSPVSTESATTTTYCDELESSTTQINNIITNSNLVVSKDEKKDAIITPDAGIVSTESTNEYSTVTNKINTESTLIDIFYDTFDNYDTINDSSTIFTDITTTESAINNRSTTSEDNRQTEYYRDVSTETSTVTDYTESIDYSDDNFIEVYSTNDDEEVNSTALSLPSTATMDQVNVLVL